MVCFSAGFRRSLRLCRRRRGQAFGTSQFCSLRCPTSCYSSPSNSYEEVVRYQHHPEHTHRLIALVGEYMFAHMWASTTRPNTAGCSGPFKINLLKSNQTSAFRSFWGRCEWTPQETHRDQPKGLPRSCSSWVCDLKIFAFYWWKKSLLIFVSIQIPHDRPNAMRSLGENITLLAKSSLTRLSTIAGVTSWQTLFLFIIIL